MKKAGPSPAFLSLRNPELLLRLVLLGFGFRRFGFRGVGFLGLGLGFRLGIRLGFGLLRFFLLRFFLLCVFLLVLLGISRLLRRGRGLRGFGGLGRRRRGGGSRLGGFSSFGRGRRRRLREHGDG